MQRSKRILHYYYAGSRQDGNVKCFTTKLAPSLNIFYICLYKESQFTFYFGMKGSLSDQHTILINVFMTLKKSYPIKHFGKYFTSHIDKQYLKTVTITCSYPGPSRPSQSTLFIIVPRGRLHYTSAVSRDKHLSKSQIQMSLQEKKIQMFHCKNHQ